MTILLIYRSWLVVKASICDGCLVLTTTENQPLISIVLYYHTFIIQSSCLVYSFTLEINLGGSAREDIQSGGCLHLFHVSSRTELLEWKEQVEIATPSIHDMRRYRVYVDIIGKGKCCHFQLEVFQFGLKIAPQG